MLATIRCCYWIPDSVSFISNFYAQIFTEHLLRTRHWAGHQGCSWAHLDMASVLMSLFQYNGVQRMMPLQDQTHCPVSWGVPWLGSTIAALLGHTQAQTLYPKYWVLRALAPKHTLGQKESTSVPKHRAPAGRPPWSAKRNPALQVNFPWWRWVPCCQQA